MSGPKVVRIVTREELEAQCRKLLRRVDTAYARLERCARASGAWNSEFSQALQARRLALQSLFDRDRWAEVQRQAPAEAEFLRSEGARIAEEAIQKTEASRRKRRKMADAARSLIAALDAAGHTVPDSLRQAVDAARTAGDKDLAAIEAELNAGLSLLVGSAERSAADEKQKALAARLGAGETPQTYTGWLETRNSADNASDLRLDRLLAELEIWDRDAVRPFLRRASAISTERSADRRALLTDSLTLDLGCYLKTEKAWQSTLADLEEARTTLKALKAGAAAGLLVRLETAITARSAEDAATVLVAASELAVAEARREASQARRLVVLKGLASLGYEIRAETAADWAASGRIVVRKPAADYGVELGAVATGERMQLRVVGAVDPVEPRNSSRDREAEVQWCSQVEALQSALVAAGAELEIERSLPPGSQPLKTAVFGNADVQAADSAAKPIARQIG